MLRYLLFKLRATVSLALYSRDGLITGEQSQSKAGIASTRQLAGLRTLRGDPARAAQTATAGHMRKTLNVYLVLRRVALRWASTLIFAKLLGHGTL